MVVIVASTPLHDAAEAGDAVAVTALLRAASGASVEHRIRRENFEWGATALQIAAQKGHVGVTKALLAFGARHDNVESYGHPVGDQLLREGGDRANGFRGCWGGDLTALHLASAHGHVAVVRELLSAGARTDWVASGRKMSIDLPLDVVGRAFFGEKDGGHTPLHLASCTGHTDVIDLLVDAGARLDTQEGQCSSPPLHLASSSGNVDAVAALLNAGADVDGVDDVGHTSLNFVANTETLELLLAFGANPNMVAASPYGGGTPLGSYCTMVHRRTTGEEGMKSATAQVKMLLEYGADTSIRASCPRPLPECPILSHAAKNGVPGIVSALLAAGLNPNEMDTAGLFPVHDAARADHVETLRLLLRAGADKDAVTSSLGWTPLHIACRYESVDCALELLWWGTDPSAKTPGGGGRPADETPADLISRRTGARRGSLAASFFAAFALAAAAAAGGGSAATADALVGEGEGEAGGSGSNGDNLKPRQGGDGQVDALSEEAEEEGDVGAAGRNTIRRALRRGISWRGKRGLVLLKAHLDKVRRDAKIGDIERGRIEGSGRGISGASVGIQPRESNNSEDPSPGHKRSIRCTTGPSDSLGVAGCATGMAVSSESTGVGSEGVILRGLLERTVGLAGYEEALFWKVVQYL